MSGLTLTLLLLGGTVVLIASFVLVSYNRFIAQRNLIAESWKQVDVELQRRFDLIPNLIETVKGYAAHERQVLENVTAARGAALARAQAGAGPAARQDTENAFTRAMPKPRSNGSPNNANCCTRPGSSGAYANPIWPACAAIAARRFLAA